MPPHDPDLELDSVGDDVGELQRELQTIGFDIDRDELQRRFFGESTQQAVAFLQEVYEVELRELGWRGREGVVERTTAIVVRRTHDGVVAARQTLPQTHEPEYVVSGVVRSAAGAPVARASVSVSNQNLRGDRGLGSGATSETGTFEIGFDFRGQDGAEARSPQAPAAPDLRFTVVDADGYERGLQALFMKVAGEDRPVPRIAQAPGTPFIIVNAPVRTEVVLYLANAAERDPLSEFEEVEARLAPALQGLRYDELTEGDGRFQISFLTAETGIVRPIIERLIAAARLSAHTAHRSRPVPVAVFYGLGHASLPLDLAALSRLPRTDLTTALRDAIEATVIPKRLGDDVDRHVDAILSIGAELALAEPMAEGRETPAAWLALAGLSAEGQQRILRELADLEGSDESLWERLRDQGELGGAEPVRRAELVLRLASFTGNNFALVRLLIDPRHVEVQSLADLAKLDEPEWAALVDRAGIPQSQRQDGEDADAAGRRYAVGLMRVAQQAFPTAAIEGIVARSDRDLALDPDLSRWLGAAQRAAEAGAVPALDLRNTHIDRYFDEHAGRIGFETKSTARLRSDLKRVQRALAIAQEPSQIVPLLRQGHDSALSVANLSVTAFLDIHGAELGAETARAIHARARQLHRAHLFVHTMVFQAVNDTEAR